MLNLEQANRIIGNSLARARALSLAPIVVAVVDAGGHLIAYQREDGAGIARFNIAFGKAWGSLGMGFGSRELSKRSVKNPTFVHALSVVTDGRMVPSPGGVLVGNASGHIVGAVGISGDIGDREEDCAVAGIVAIGLKAFPGKVI
jgi:uncharacterized protein GlcG (DUF336 family)